jgi:hypothetical protein
LNTAQPNTAQPNTARQTSLADPARRPADAVVGQPTAAPD